MRHANDKTLPGLNRKCIQMSKITISSKTTSNINRNRMTILFGKQPRLQSDRNQVHTVTDPMTSLWVTSFITGYQIFSKSVLCWLNQMSLLHKSLRNCRRSKQWRRQSSLQAEGKKKIREIEEGGTMKTKRKDNVKKNKEIILKKLKKKKINHRGCICSISPRAAWAH